MNAILAGALVAGIGCLAAATGWLRRRYRTVEVLGTSMQPTLQPGEVVRLARRDGRRVRTGELVVVAAPVRVGSGWYWPAGNPTKEWSIKRVAATAGEPVPVELLDAVAARPGTAVPAGKLLFLGDHRAVSVDSRHWGYLPACAVLGVVRRSAGS